MANTDINLSPYTAESEAIARRMKMAELLQQQAMQPLETPGMAGGYQLAVSPYAGLAKILQGYNSMQAGRGAEAERKALGERYQSDLISTLNRANELSFGKPAIAEQAPVTQVDDEGYPNPVVAGSPAVAPNPEAAAREYFKHPATQAMGMNQLQKIAQTQQFINAGNAGNAPPITSVTNAGVTPATSTSGSTVVPQGGSQKLASALTGFGGLAGGQRMELYLQTDPTGKSYLEQLAKDFSDANKPTDKIRELSAAGVKPGSPQWNAALTNINTAGGIFQPNAQGGVELAKGFAVGAGDIKRAEEEAKAENEVVTRMVGGREVLGTNRQFKILATGDAATVGEAKSVAAWANRNKIQLGIDIPSTGGTPQGASEGSAPGQTGSVSNPTSAELAEAKEFATGGAASINKKLDESYALARNSVDRIVTLNELKSSIALPAFSGPGTSTQLTLGQLANKFYGAKNSEVLVNTTAKLQGLADLSLKAAGLMQGQGAITGPERDLLERAKSAPKDLTVPEYKAVFAILERQDAAIIKQHQEIINRAKRAGSRNTDFYIVDVPIPNELNLSPRARELLGGKP